jgi:predicted RNA-binding Zn-ribbon protein involved in translation (DUF1610 family)
LLAEGEVGFHDLDSSVLGRRQNADGKSVDSRLHQPSKQALTKCSECGSQKIWKDGARPTNFGEVQRYICRNCGFRFSERSSAKSFNMTSGKSSSCQIGADPFAHGQVINLAAIEPLKEGPAGATTLTNADLKGKIVQYLWYMKKQGYAETTTQTYFHILEMLQRKNANLNDPESVKEVLAKHDCGKGRKWNMVKAYTLFLKMQGLTWRNQNTIQ